jgi:hypothetical protein
MRALSDLHEQVPGISTVPHVPHLLLYGRSQSAAAEVPV